jgi:hypothetical protein
MAEANKSNFKSNGASNNEKSGMNKSYYRKGGNNFKEKFESDDTHHSFCLTATGCFDRHNIPRKAQYLSDKENSSANFSTFNKTEYQERQLMSMVASLQKQGCPLLSNESLDEFVMRNKNKLTEEHQQLLERN